VNPFFKRWARAWCALATTLLAAWPASAEPVSVVDDRGQRITLPAPARRIISLAPHTTEILYAAGAGSHVVATVRWSDYPPEAQKLPRVGDGLLLDLERIVALRPDLIVVWMHGNAQAQIDRLRALGLPIFNSEPKSIAGIANSVRRIGKLAGTETQAETAASAFEDQYRTLRVRFANRPPVRVFYQIWHEPVMTVNDTHLISDVLRLCGGVNVFGALGPLVPTVDTEAVLRAHPQVLLAGVLPGREDESLDRWRALRHFEPTAEQLLFALPSDFISRHGPRILQGVSMVCERLEQTRTKLGLTQ
jgi:iron complex transport system substrate-binding protein